MLWNLGFHFVLLYFQVLDNVWVWVCCFGWWLVTGSWLGPFTLLQRSSLMLGHRLDACALHSMHCASYVMPCASCLMFGHRLDVCASCVEPGAPWVTEASSFAVFFIFFSLWHYDTQVYISGFCRHISSFLTWWIDGWCRGCMDSVLIP